MVLSVPLPWDQACFCQPKTERAAFAEGHSPWTGAELSPEAVGETESAARDAQNPSAWLPPSSPSHCRGFCLLREDLGVLRDRAAPCCTPLPWMAQDLS